MTEEQKEIRYVCFKTPDKVYGIDICDLVSQPKEEEAVVNWDSLPPIPAALKADLPAFCTQLVELGSNFCLFGGFCYPQRGGSRCGSPSFKVFELKLIQFQLQREDPRKKLTCRESKLIPQPPQPFGKLLSECFEIRGDFYFIVFDPMVPAPSPTFSWVLRSRTRKWESLPTPPCLYIDYEVLQFMRTERYLVVENLSQRKSCFTLLILSLKWDMDQTRPTFNVQGHRRFYCPVMRLPAPGFRDYSIHLSTSHIEKSDLFGAWDNGYRATLHALLVNERGVRIVQPIENCFDGIQPSFICASPVLISLGTNMICAMLFGFTKEHHNCRCPLVCISVFHYSVMEDAIDIDYINSSSLPKVQNFLTVNVMNKHVYSMIEYLENSMTDDDLYPFLDEIKGFTWKENKA
ncbi:hypothetical protein PIB30_086842 [Stylosanthes scabra]|uniref:DUF1618 domain-containing protein n=1 Tax=Stylosanthes scabra TaxID=79078 RepID=A0ABU6XR19_9FABA|nr:hypothetical protein [Stylosanthes scabra]